MSEEVKAKMLCPHCKEYFTFAKDDIKKIITASGKNANAVDCTNCKITLYVG